MRRLAALVVLVVAVATAAVLGALAYGASTGDSPSPDGGASDAVRLFEASHSADAAPADRRRAETAAQRVVEAGGDPAERSVASNLLGVLAFENVSLDRPNAAAHAAASVAAFREAVRLDPSNDDAKFNLELALTLLADDAAAGTGAGRPGTGASTGSGAGATPPGGGY